MELEKTSPELNALATKVFKVAELLAGESPVFDPGSGWYKFGSPIIAWIRLIGPTGRKLPANSVHIVATQSTPELESSAEDIGNNMFGKKTPEFVVRLDDPHSFAGFLEFIGRAYTARFPVEN